jgi:hypothetical protein
MINETIRLHGGGIIKGNEIYVPHLDETLIFTLPDEKELLESGSPYNGHIAGDYMDAAGIKSLFGEGQRPTTSQVFSLVNLALHNKNNKICRFILTRFARGLFTSTMNLYTPQEIIVYDNPKGMMPSDRVSLLERVSRGDSAVRVVPYGFKLGYQSVDEFLENPFVFAHIGNNDITKTVREVAETSKEYPPSVKTLERPTQDFLTYTTLESFHSFDWLRLQGNPDFGQGAYGFPMNIQKK